MDPSQAVYAERYWRKFICINEKDRFIYGNFDSVEARLLNVQLKRCEGAGCKSPDEITEFFRNKFVLMLSN